MYWDFRILLSHCYAQMKISFPGLIFAQYKSINIIIIIILLLASVLDVRLLFLRDWSFKSECECDLWRPPLPESTIGLPTGRVLCILVIVKNFGILGDFGLN